MGTIERLEQREILTLNIIVEELTQVQDELSDACPNWEPGEFLPGLLEDAIVRLGDLLERKQRQQG